MRWCRHTSLLQSAIKAGTKFVNRHRPIQFLPVDEQGGGSADAYLFAFAKRSFDRLVILCLDAGLELRHIHLMLFALGYGDAVQCGKLGIAAFFGIHIFLIAMDVVGKIPVGVVALRSEAVGVYRSSG